MKKTIYILTGPPASGKTTIANMMASLIEERKVRKGSYEHFVRALKRIVFDENIELLIVDDCRCDNILNEVIPTAKTYYPNAVLVICTQDFFAFKNPAVARRRNIQIIRCNF